MQHRSPITTIDHHAGATTPVLVTGGYDGRVIAWGPDAALWTAQFDDLVNDVRIDPSGTRLAVAVADRAAFILDVHSGARLDMLGPHGDDVNAVRWSPDGRRLVCVMDHLDTDVTVWAQDASGEWANTSLTGHESGVFGAAFDPTGTRLATVAEDATGRIWDLASGTQTHVLEHPGDPEAMDWSPDGSTIVTGCDDGIARIWDPTTGALTHQLTEAGAAVRFLRFDATGYRLIAGAYDATLRIYRCSDWSVIDEFQGPFQWERAACFTSDGIAIGGFTGAPFNYSLDGRPVDHSQELSLTRGINALCQDDGRLFVGRDDGAVADVLTTEVLRRHESIVNTVALSPDGSMIASADYRGVINLTGLDGNDTAATASADGGGPINSIVWHPTGDRLFTGGYDGVVRRWAVEAGAIICAAQWVAHHGPIKSLAWSTTNEILVAGSSDGSLTGWSDSAELWRASADDLVLVNAVAVADDEGVVVTASRDLRVRRWDVRTGALLETLPHGHTKSVKAIAVSNDGATIVTGSYDGTAILWRRSAGVWSWRPLRHHGKPGVPAVALGDQQAFTAGWDGTVGQWSLDGELLVTH